MRRATATATLLASGLLLASCGGSATSASTPKPAAPATPSATASVANGATAPPATGEVLLDISGSGNKRSNAFTTHGTWDIVWEAESEPNVISGAFIAINIYDTDGKPVAETVMADIAAHEKKSDVAHMHYAGAVYLDITAASSWHVKAVAT